MCLTSSAEGGTGKISDCILQVESTFRVNFYFLKSTFLFGKTIFDKVLELVEGASKPLQCKKTLKVLTKS